MHFGGFSIHATGMPEGSAFMLGPLQVMQSTGLRDKHGKEIYEGDILDFDPAEWADSRNEAVPSLETFAAGWPLCGTASDLLSFRAVIGNIHSNPELIDYSADDHYIESTMD